MTRWLANCERVAARARTARAWRNENTDVAEVEAEDSEPDALALRFRLLAPLLHV